MSEPFELLSKEAIGKWLKERERKIGPTPRADNRHPGVSLYTIANYIGTTRDELKWRTNKPTMSTERQRLFSKMIAQIENGQLVVWQDPVTLKKTLVPCADPKPLAPKYQANFTAGGKLLGLKPVERPKPVSEMPKFGSLLTKRK